MDGKVFSVRIFALLLLAALAGGCGSSSTDTSVGGSAPPPVASAQRLTGLWTGSDVSLHLTEVDGVVGGMGTVGVLPVHVTGGRLPDDEVFLSLLPADGSLETDNLSARGQFAQGTLQLRLGGTRDVQLRSSAGAQSSGHYLVDAPPYQIHLNTDAQTWSSNLPLLDSSTGSLASVPSENGHYVLGFTTPSGAPCGQVSYNFLSGGSLKPFSWVLTSQFDSVELHGTIASEAAAQAAVAPSPAASPAAVGGVWSGANFRLEVTQTGSLLSAAGTYRGALMRGTGRVLRDNSAGLFLNTLFGETGVDGVTILRRPDGQLAVTDSARGTTESSKLWDDNLQTFGDSYTISSRPPERDFLLDVTGTGALGFTGSWSVPSIKNQSGTIAAFDQGGASTAVLHFATTTLVVAQFTWPRISSGVSGTSVNLTAGEFLGERTTGSATLTKP